MIPAEARRRSQEESEAFAAWWRMHPAQVALRARLDGLSEEDVTGAVAAAHALFDNDAWPAELILALAEHIAGNPWFEPPFRAIEGDAHAGLLLIDDPRVAVTLSCISLDRLALRKTGGKGARRAIGFSGEMSLIRVLRSGGAVFSLWEAPFAGPDFAGGEGRSCRPAGHIALTDGMTLLIDGRSQSYVIERATADIMLLQARIGAGRGPLLVEYDAGTLDYLSASAAEEVASRIQMMAALLAAMKRRDGAEALSALIDDPRFFLRWQAMRAWAALDPAGALPPLSQMAKADPHPEVRATAARTLERVRAVTAGRVACLA